MFLLIFSAYCVILGYRYELYCGSKANKNTQCTVHTEINRDQAWNFNETRPESEKYNRESFDALVMRYEDPDGKNRWDSPLFVIFPGQELDKSAIKSCLFDAEAVKPNMSTQNVQKVDLQVTLSNFNFFSLHLVQLIFCTI